MKTKQETFDYVVAKIIEQGKPSWSTEDECCAYRGDNGTKCAAGWLIPDELYSEDMEGALCYLEKPILLPGMGRGAREVKRILEEAGYDAEFVLKLQVCHDEASREPEFLVAFKENCVDLARRCGLEYKFD